MDSMVLRNRDRILEAIDQLRRRKARPDLQRICNFLFRKYSINSSEASSCLQWCVEHNFVLKVEYKGNISYRNAAKKLEMTLKRSENHSGDYKRANKQNLFEKANRKFAHLLTSAFSQLIVNDPDYLDFGISAEDIIENILSKDSVRYSKKYISILLEKELANGGLVRAENGNFLMGPATPTTSTNSMMKTQAAASIKTYAQNERVVDSLTSPVRRVQKKNPNKIVKVRKFKSGFKDMSTKLSQEHKSDSENTRMGVKRKRAVKKVFDPSDTHVPKKRGRPAGSTKKDPSKQSAITSDESRPESRNSNSGKEQYGVCSVCHSQSKKGANDRLVPCRECSNKAHFSCLNKEDMMLRMYPDNTWQCPHCKTCVVCFETSDAGYLTVCSICADAYHSNCHQPHITDKIKNNTKWLCVNCQLPDELEVNKIESNIEPYARKSTSNAGDDEVSSISQSGTNSPSLLRSLQPSPETLTIKEPPLSPKIEDDSSADEGGNQVDSGSSEDDSNIDPSIPDASHWTSEEVYQYFARYFPKEAKVFREQEIDGRSLLLMRRIDVLTNLKLKLGPALKIYKHVIKLQVRRDDPKLYWL